MRPFEVLFYAQPVEIEIAGLAFGQRIARFSQRQMPLKALHVLPDAEVFVNQFIAEIKLPAGLVVAVGHCGSSFGNRFFRDYTISGADIQSREDKRSIPAQTVKCVWMLDLLQTPLHRRAGRDDRLNPFLHFPDRRLSDK